MADYEQEYRRMLDYKDDEILYLYKDGFIVPDVDETFDSAVSPVQQISDVPKLPTLSMDQPDILRNIGTPGERAAAAGFASPEYEKKFQEVLTGVAEATPKVATDLIKQTVNLAVAIGPAATNKVLQEAVRFGAEIVDAAGGMLGKNPEVLNRVRDIVPQIEVKGAVASISKDLAAAAWTLAILKSAGTNVLTASAATDALQNIEEGNLATLAEEFGFMKELAQYFNSKVGRDASAEKRLNARMKAVFEGLGIATSFSAIFQGIKNIKKVGPAALSLVAVSDAELLKNVNSDTLPLNNAGVE